MTKLEPWDGLGAGLHLLLACHHHLPGWWREARVVESREQHMELQCTIDRLEKWSEDWQMLFNSEKCHILHLGFNNRKLEYRMGGRVLETVEFDKDVGVIVH